MIKSLAIKAVMLAMTVALVAWIGWPTREAAFIDAFTDPPRDSSVSPQTVASTVFSPISGALAVAKSKEGKLSKTTQVDAGPKLDINHATVEELRTLPGIGGVLAQRMIARRTEQGPYRTIEDLRAVKGIGAKRLEKLRTLVVVGKASASEVRAKREL
ncbi:MAG: ComEA family DNA-binding protein [Nitrospiraceae bacterium]